MSQELPEHLRDLVPVLVEAMRHLQPQPTCLSEQEQQWVRAAIASEGRRLAFRDAVIQKTLSGLAWAGLVLIGTALWELIKNRLTTGGGGQ